MSDLMAFARRWALVITWGLIGQAAVVLASFDPATWSRLFWAEWCSLTVAIVVVAFFVRRWRKP